MTLTCVYGPSSYPPVLALPRSPFGDGCQGTTCEDSVPSENRSCPPPYCLHPHHSTINHRLCSTAVMHEDNTVTVVSWYLLVLIRTPICTGKDLELYTGLVREETYPKSEVCVAVCVGDPSLHCKIIRARGNWNPMCLASRTDRSTSPVLARAQIYIPPHLSHYRCN